MTYGTLILRSLRFHARSHLGVVLGAAVGSAALIGALVVGDTVLLRVRKPTALSQDAVITPRSDAALALRLRVKAIVSAASLGNFNLAANQVAPFNAFVRLDFVARQTAIPERANMLLSGPAEGVLFLNNFFKIRAALEDMELELRQLSPQRMCELRSPRIFLESPIIRA